MKTFEMLKAVETKVQEMQESLETLLKSDV